MPGDQRQGNGPNRPQSLFVWRDLLPVGRMPHSVGSRVAMKRRDPDTGSLWHVFSSASVGGQGVDSSAKQKAVSHCRHRLREDSLGQQCYEGLSKTSLGRPAVKTEGASTWKGGKLVAECYKSKPAAGSGSRFSPCSPSLAHFLGAKVTGGHHHIQLPFSFQRP